MNEKPAAPKRTAATKPATTRSTAGTTTGKPTTATAKPAAKPAAPQPAPIAAKPAAAKKPKKVRDSFSMPQDDYERIAGLKKACLKIGVVAKKSELLRAGLQQLGKLKPAELKQALAAVQTKK